MKIHFARPFLGLRCLFFTSFASATFKARKAAPFLLSVAVLLAGGAAAVCAQSALDGFDPNANGAVRVVVVQPHGKILVGGVFSGVNSIGAQERNHIARLNPGDTIEQRSRGKKRSGRPG